jgi:hypothetical protein
MLQDFPGKLSFVLREQIQIEQFNVGATETTLKLSSLSQHHFHRLLMGISCVSAAGFTILLAHMHVRAHTPRT